MYAKPLALLGLVAGLVFAGAALAGRPGPGEPSDWQPPWMKPNFPGYTETIRPTQPPSAIVTGRPMKYGLVVTQVPWKPSPEDADRVVLMGHLPEDAQVWLEGAATSSVGAERFYKSPPLKAGREYHYSIRAAWAEDGHWVSKEATVAVKAGEKHCFFLQKAATTAEKDAEVHDNLAKLSPEDRTLAETQRVCVVEGDTRLGAVGVPLKVMVKNEAVFVCCKNCVKAAQADPDKTLAKVKELRAKNADTTK